MALRKAAIGGLVAGALAQFLASPTDLIKVQMQMEGRRRLEGKPVRCCLLISTVHALLMITLRLNGLISNFYALRQKSDVLSNSFLNA